MKKDTITGGGGGGFTLIEMLIVIAIIAVLSGIVLVGVTGFQASARDAKRVAQLRSAQNMAELYYAQCGHYPGGTDCTDTEEATWDGFVTALAIDNDKDELPMEGDDDGDTHDYESCFNDSDSVQSYTMGITLEKGSAAAVQDGYTGDETCLPSGVDCEDPDVFCLSE